MTIAHLVLLAELLSSVLIVFGFGLRSTVRDATSLFRHPLLLARALLATSVLMPLFAASIVAVFSLRPAIGIALIALAVSPVPPILPDQQLKLVAQQDYVFGLFGASSLLAIVLAPLTVVLIGVVFAREVRIAPSAIAATVGVTVLVPFSLGMIVRRLRPAFAERVSPRVGQFGMWLLFVAAIPILITEWPAMISLIGNGTLIALVTFTGVGLAAGHLLGGPDAGHRTVLALGSASRHPGVALTIATEIFPDQELVAPALLLSLLVGAIASAPYALWRRTLQRGSAPNA
jgi:bile acid:Na+ symporter, BASS family